MAPSPFRIPQFRLLGPARPCSRARWQRPVRLSRVSWPCPFKLYFVRNVGGIDRLQRTFSSRLFDLARLAGSFLLRFTGIEPIITRKTARQKNRRASLSVL